MGEVLAARQSSILGIQLIAQVIRGIQTNSRQVTGLHAIFFQMCLDSLNFKVALPFLIDDVDEFSAEVNNCQNFCCNQLRLDFNDFFCRIL